MQKYVMKVSHNEYKSIFQKEKVIKIKISKHPIKIEEFDSHFLQTNCASQQF